MPPTHKFHFCNVQSWGQYVFYARHGVSICEPVISNIHTPKRWVDFHVYKSQNLEVK